MFPLVLFVYYFNIFGQRNVPKKITFMIDYYFNYLKKKIHKHLSIQLCFNRNYVDDVPVMEFLF